MAASTLLIQHQRYTVALMLLEKMLAKFANSAQSGQLHLDIVTTLLQINHPSKIRSFIETLITAHHTDSPLDLETRKKLQVLFWQQAVGHFENDNHSEALTWYNYVASLYGCNDGNMDANRAKLYRNIASCHLHLQDIPSAKEAIDEAKLSDPSSPYTHYLLYKVAVLSNNTEHACISLNDMVRLSDPDAKGGDDTPSLDNLIALSAHLALEKGNERVALVALGRMIDVNKSTKQTLTALRCCIRIQIKSLDNGSCKASEILQNIKKAQKRLEETNDASDIDNDVRSKEIEWFGNVAWNLALQCEHEPALFRDLFMTVYELIKLDECSQAVVSKQKTCLMMAIAGGLQQARTETDQSKMITCLKDTLEAINLCRQLCEEFYESTATGVTRRNAGDILLHLYEFEAKAKLRDPHLEAVLKKIFALPYSDAKTFETLAALAMEPPANSKSVSIRALKAAVHKHLQAATPDAKKLSKNFHSLVTLGLQTMVNSTDTSKEEGYSYCHEVVEVLDNKTLKDYPEVEILWLMTKVWNCGIHFYSQGQNEEAEKWCALSMRLLKHLETMSSTYSVHMSTVYGDILAAVGNSKPTPMEE